nr:hypothetical protein BaRGS_000182 [Batillaria attramentaria]
MRLYTRSGRVYCDNNHPESTAITDAFFDLLGIFNTGTPTAPIQLLSRASGLDKDRFMEGEVTVDQDVGNRTTFLVTYTRSLPHVQVVSPSGRVYSHLCPEYSVDTRLQVVKILIPKLAEIGRWRYKVTNPGTYQVTSLQVLSSPANASVLPARLSGSLVLRRNSWPTTINIFAEVTKGRKPVTDLKVTATVRFPYGQSVKIDLMDNGAGADIVEGDGVYSRYFSRFTAPGVYTVTLSATGHTDSLMRFVERTAPAGHFVLHPNMSHSRTRRDTGSDDTEAPVRISDLRVVKTSAQHRTVELSWTASGDDTDHETASEYEILIAPSTKDLMTRSSLVQRLTQDDVTHGYLTAPKPFGAREHVTIHLPQAPGSTGVYVISVVAVDDAGNKGDHSNYVTVGLGKVPDVTDPGNWQEDGVTSAEPETPRDETLVILAIVATVFALLVLIILVSLTVCITLRKKTAEPSSVQNSKGFDLEAVKDERVLVHEWAHFRWGVFDEYALSGEPQFYYSPKSGTLEGVRCTEKIRGIIARTNPDTGRTEYCHQIDAATGLYPEGCEFKPYPAGPATNGVEASIMDHVLIPPIKSFCDDNSGDDATVHNYDAPSRHNRLCGHRSTWAVISESEDFQSGKNPPRDGVATQPVFHLVKAPRSRRMILALDTSASMQGDNKLTRMRQAVGTFVKEGVAPATEVGLTTFSDTARVRRAPTPLNTSDDRQSFANDLPGTAEDATSITSALIAATQMLGEPQTTQTPINVSSNETTPEPAGIRQDGGHVVVVTDGQETTGPDLKSALPLLHGAGVVVSFMVLGGPPHPDILHLAQATGGRVYCDNNHPDSTAITDAFFDVLGIFDTGNPTAPIQLLSRASGLDKDRSMEGEVTVDQDVGNRTTFLVTYTRSLPHVQVVSPSGRVYSHLYPEYSVDTGLQVVKILIPLRAETGRWHYKVTNPGTYQVTSLLVLSSPANASVLPARLSGSLVLRRNSWPTTMHIFAEVTKGQLPVTDLQVTAKVDTPDGHSVKVELMDNGAGADIVEGDGVYSRYFSRFTTPGVYTVTLSATGHKEQDTADAAGSDDNEAPVRISDLRVVKTSGQNRTVVLSWRASGDDADHETASHYEILMGPTASDLMRQTSQVHSLTQADVIHGNLVEPKPFGAREYLKIRMPKALGNNGSYVITVIAVDDAGNKGDHSNYVTVGLGNVPDVTDEKYWQGGKWEAATTKLSAPQDQRMVIAVLLGSVSVMLVLVILVSVFVSFFSKKKDDVGLPKPRSNSRHVHVSVVEMGNGRKGQDIALA